MTNIRPANDLIMWHNVAPNSGLGSVMEILIEPPLMTLYKLSVCIVTLYYEKRNPHLFSYILVELMKNDFGQFKAVFDGRGNNHQNFFPQIDKFLAAQ